MSPRPLPLPLILAAALTLALGGCTGCDGVGAQDDGGTPPPVADAGGRDAGIHRPDGGATVDGGTPDAGPPFRTGYADEPCPDAGWAFEPPDGGFPEGTHLRGLCIALTTLTGTSELDGQPPTAPIQLTFDGAEYLAETAVPVDPSGRYETRVMRARYNRLLYHPSELADHAGPKDFGTIDMRLDQSRDLSARTWTVTGAAHFAGHPWRSSVSPPDTTLVAQGIAPQQAWGANMDGTYQVRLLEGAFSYKVSVPFEALGETRLKSYPVRSWVDLREDTTIDIDLPTSELSGSFTLDGQPFPDRIANGVEFLLDYVPAGESASTVTTIHQGGTGFYSALVPKGTYSVNLELLESTDPSLPSQLYNKQVAVGLDLTQNRPLDIDLRTHKVEGALLIDGVPVVPNPAYTWSLYALSQTLGSQSWFIAYYHVPLTSSSFTLRALPGHYTLYLYLDPNLAPDLAEGWYLVSSAKEIWEDVSLPIDVPTHVLTGTLLIDGQPARSTVSGGAGTLTFESSAGYFRHKVRTTDGSFSVRLPRGSFDVYFEINPEAYPDYATGRQSLRATVDMKQPQHVTLDYVTVPVGGPLLVDGEQVPDALPVLPELSLRLRTTVGWGSFQKPLEGGRPWYFLRVPKDDYKLTFELKPGVLDGVAPGTAPIGNNLILDPP